MNPAVLILAEKRYNSEASGLLLHHFQKVVIDHCYFQGHECEHVTRKIPYFENCNTGYHKNYDNPFRAHLWQNSANSLFFTKNVTSMVNRDVIHVDDVITMVSDYRFLKTYIKSIENHISFITCSMIEIQNDQHFFQN